jgi:Asp-tRNA(Asn)/Glu-tRNA(Gln) amidotransferase A subunit family amidase
MKPTHEAVSTEGQKAFAPTFDTFGFFARSVEDLQLLADIFGLKDDGSPKDMPLKEMSVAIMKTPMWSQAGPGTVAAMEKATAILRDGGIEVAEVPFPDQISDPDALKDIQNKITRGEAQAAFLREYRVDKPNLSPQVCRLVENHSNYTRKEIVEASDTYSEMRRSMNRLAENYSVILTPSAVDEAPLGLGDMGAATFNTMWTVSPSLSLQED